MQAFGDVENIRPRNRVALVIFEDLNKATESVESCVGHGALAGREQMPGSVQRGSDFLLRDLQHFAQFDEMTLLERLRVWKAVHVMQPNPEC